jgi:hypothetical protein
VRRVCNGMRRRVSVAYARWAVVVRVKVAAVQKFRARTETAETELVRLPSMFVVVAAACQRAVTHNPPFSACARHSFGSGVHDYIVAYISGHH